jgi:hypothetical protein
MPQYKVLNRKVISLLALTLALTMFSAVNAAYLEITYTGQLEPFSTDPTGLDGATFVWQGLFDADALRISTNNVNTDSFQTVAPPTLTLSGTAGGANDGTYVAVSNSVWETTTASWDNYSFVGYVAVSGFDLIIGPILVPSGFTGAVSPTNTITPVNTPDVLPSGFGSWQMFDADGSNYEVINGQVSTITLNAPVANDDAYSATEDTELVVMASGVLSNDTDADEDSLTAVLDASTTSGSVTFNSDGSFSYVPAADYCGPDSFTYHANDGVLDSNIATVSIDVACVTDPAAFLVTKSFSDGSIAEVEVTLTCNSGLPLEQSFLISDGHPVNFVITNFTEGEVDCEVTETGTADGYTPSYDNGSVVSDVSCAYTDVASGEFSCAITNNADPATFTVYKEWVIEGAVGHEVLEEARVTIYCNNEIQGGGANGSYYYLSGTLVGDGDSLTATVDTTLQSAQCWAEEDLFESGVESENDCGSRSIPAGGSSSCTFTNTVFFEGIPTLSQYGMAIMALLMLGLGFVGLRRFV